MIFVCGENAPKNHRRADIFRSLLPKEYGNWHTIYMRLNRWSKNGTLERIFEALQNEGIIALETKIVCIDSTTVKVHPDAAGCLKKTASRALGVPKADSQQRFIWLPRLPNQS